MIKRRELFVGAGSALSDLMYRTKNYVLIRVTSSAIASSQ